PAFGALAVQLERAGKQQNAIEILEKGASLCPDSAAVHAELGFLYVRPNRRAKARASLQEATRLQPDLFDAVATLARLELADSEFVVAADTLRRALELRPTDSALRVDFGRCLLELGDRLQGEQQMRVAASQSGT